MPGTIQVSILGISGFPSLSPSSSITIRVSLGKQFFETTDKGDFSFPLVTFKDILNVAVYDNGGNELAHAGVEAKLIIEKGSWDDLFPFEGGGHVHMRLQFVLNDGERKRIRAMRESAFRKKQQELLEKEHEQPVISLTYGDSQESHNGINLSNPGDMKHDEQIFGSGSKIFHISRVDELDQAIPEQPEPTGAVEELIVTSLDTQVIQQCNLEKENPLEKTSNNVRKMITAFESSPSKQLEMRPSEYLSTAKSESSGTRVVVSSKGSVLSTTCAEPESNEPAKAPIERESDPSVPSTYTRKVEDAYHGSLCQLGYFNTTNELRSESHDQNYSEDSKSRNFDAVDEGIVELGSLNKSDDLSTSETSECMGTPDHVVSSVIPCDNCMREEYSSNDPLDLEVENHQKLSPNSVKLSQVPHEEEHYSDDGSWNWIAIKGQTCSSTASASTLVIDLPTSCPSEMSDESHDKLDKTSVTPEEQGGFSTRVKKLEPAGNSKDPMGLVIKIGIMIGFGLFVLLTRQRKPRTRT